jgi:hypothetical protein
MKPLKLCLSHKQEWKQSHYSEENCDYCKLEKKLAKIEAPVNIKAVMQPFITANNILIKEIEDLTKALQPFANYACDPPCGCHNCIAKKTIESLEVKCEIFM